MYVLNITLYLEAKTCQDIILNENVQVFDSESVQDKCKFGIAELNDSIKKYIICEEQLRITWKRTYYRVIDKKFDEQTNCPLYVYSVNKINLKYKRICQKPKNVKIFCKRKVQSNVVRNIILVVVSILFIFVIAILSWWFREKIKVCWF